jgi:hypothetical protein
MEIKTIARWSGWADVVLRFDNGVEIPAKWTSAAGRIYFYDGRGRERTLDVIGCPPNERYVLDAFRGRRDFDTSADLLRYLEEETGPAPRGRAQIVGQVGAQFVYACVPHDDKGAGE